MVSGLFKDTVTLSRQSRLEAEPGSVTLTHFRIARMLQVVLSWLFQFPYQLQVLTLQQHLPRVPCCPLETSGGNGNACSAYWLWCLQDCRPCNWWVHQDAQTCPRTHSGSHPIAGNRWQENYCQTHACISQELCARAGGVLAFSGYTVDVQIIGDVCKYARKRQGQR